MAAKTIYIFRHGQTDYNAARRAMGRLDIPLNETGVQQATELAQKMSGTSIQAIYSSPLSRALQTAQIVSEKIGGAPILQNDGLMERNMGKLQGHIVHKTDNPAEYSTDYNQMELFMPAEQLNDKNWRPDGGETQVETFRRAQQTIMDIIKSTPYDTIAISTHSGPVRAILELTGGGDAWINNWDYVKLTFDGKILNR